MVDVFISYSRANQPLVRQLAEAVKLLGYTVWWDDELPAHLSYSDVITDKIGAAKAAIVVWSQDAAASEWVRAEADVARGQKKLIQASIDGRMPPMPFNQIQFAEIGDWQGQPDHPGWKKIKDSLAALCGSRTESNAAPVTRPVTSAPAKTASSVKWIPVLAVVLLVAIAGGYFLFERGRAHEPVSNVNQSGGGTAAIPAATGSPVSDARFTEAATVDALEGPVEIRSGPAAAAFVVGRINRGDVLTTYPQDGDWQQVRTATGTVGYVPRRQLRALTTIATRDGGPGLAPVTTNVETAAAAEEPRQVAPESSERLLRPEEIERLSSDDLRIARNEIFARHGRIFQDPTLRAHFQRYRWYREQAVEVSLSQIEEANVRMLQGAATR